MNNNIKKKEKILIFQKLYQKKVKCHYMYMYIEYKVSSFIQIIKDNYMMDTYLYVGV